MSNACHTFGLGSIGTHDHHSIIDIEQATEQAQSKCLAPLSFCQHSLIPRLSQIGGRGGGGRDSLVNFTRKAIAFRCIIIIHVINAGHPYISNNCHMINKVPCHIRQ